MGTDEQGALHGVHNQVLVQVVLLTNICLIYNLYTTIFHTTMEMTAHLVFCLFKAFWITALYDWQLEMH